MSSFTRDGSPRVAFRDEVSGHRFSSGIVETFLESGGPSGHRGTSFKGRVKRFLIRDGHVVIAASRLKSDRLHPGP